jgi:hypothetical protein
MLNNDLLVPVLSRLVKQPDWETEWLDLLSQLEYVGCRKILKSVSFDDVDHQILRHIYEEASHALFLKELVVNRGSRRPWSEGKFSAVGWRYFQLVDESVSSLQKDSQSAPYPAVSWTIEQRVLSVYPLYLDLTQDPQVKKTIARILVQERRHSQQFEGPRLTEDLRQAFLSAEAELWAAFCGSLEILVPQAT